MEQTCSCTGKSLERFLQATILKILDEQDLHGFLLIKEIGASPMYQSSYPDPSGVYRCLKKLETIGLLESYEETQEGFPSKQIYHITEEGRKCLVNWKATIKEYEMQLRAFHKFLDERKNL